jgi:enolase
MYLKDVVKSIKARQILTSRGIPTTEVDFITHTGAVIRSSVPSGASTGSKEAAILVDNSSEYSGQSVLNVVNMINNLEKDLLKEHFRDQEEFDSCLIKFDGTDDKSRLGSNLILPLSICFSKLLAFTSSTHLHRSLCKAKNLKMPLPNFNMLNGGMHSGNGFSCQEIMVCFDTGKYSKNLERSSFFHKALKSTIGAKYGSIFTGVGDEGGFAPPMKNIEEGIDLIIETGKAAKIDQFTIALDFAANSFFKNGKYNFDGQSCTGKQLADIYIELLNKYPQIYSMEDPFEENDYESWEYFYAKTHTRINIVADDLTVSNPKIIKQLSFKKMFNTVLIKPNQIGSVSETLKSIQICTEKGFKVMVSHRSAETEDTFISSLAVGVNASYIKCGSPCRGERISKYNELLRIEEDVH